MHFLGGYTKRRKRKKKTEGFPLRFRNINCGGALQNNARFLLAQNEHIVKISNHRAADRAHRMRITRYGTCPLQACRSNTRPTPAHACLSTRSITPPDDELLIAGHSFPTALLSSKSRIFKQKFESNNRSFEHFDLH